MPLDLSKIPFNVLHDIRKNLHATKEEADLPVGEFSGDEQIAQMSPRTALDRFLTWHGIIGWTGLIMDAVDGVRDAAERPEINFTTSKTTTDGE